MTDWDITNLVGGHTLHRSDRSAPTGQTGLCRDWSNSVLRAKNIALKRKKDEPEPMQIDSGKARVESTMQIGDMKIIVQDAPKGPMIFVKSVNTFQKSAMANDHEAGSSNSEDQDKEKYLQPR